MKELLGVLIVPSHLRILHLQNPNPNKLEADTNNDKAESIRFKKNGNLFYISKGKSCVCTVIYPLHKMVAYAAGAVCIFRCGDRCTCEVKKSKYSSGIVLIKISSFQNVIMSFKL